LKKVEKNVNIKYGYASNHRSRKLFEECVAALIKTEEIVEKMAYRDQLKSVENHANFVVF